MIQNWNVSNFKSISKESLELAPLTLFAGANSSGKSTLLQSLLLITQTLAARASTQTVLLNGHLTKLGQFDDVRNSVTHQPQISLGWTLTPIVADDHRLRPFSRVQTQIECIKCEVQFGLSDAAQPSEQLDPILFHVSFSSRFRPRSEATGRESHFSLTRRQQPSSQPSTPAERARTRFTFEFTIELDSDSLEELRDSYANAIPIACSLQTFLPASLVLRFDLKAETIRALHGVLTGALRRPLRAHILSGKVPATFVSRLCQMAPQLTSELAPLLLEAENDEISSQDLLESIRKIDIRSIVDPDLIHEIETAATEELPEKNDVTWAQLPSRPIDDPIDYMRDFFARQVKYLGPLREEPKSVYPLQNTADPQDIGLQGEHTAAVLHRNRYTEVECILSSNFSGDMSGDFQPMTIPLEDAVFDWITYLDVAEKVTTSDEGKFGYSLKVTMSGDTVAHDLTHVGVGVSQVLPIVVMCLLTGRDTTLVLEQPELHLNPKVQTRLADFFLSMAMLQKQCLIETHSEYLINRLRLRAARAEGKSVSIS